MRKLIFVLLPILFNNVYAQQYSLYNTRTLFDSFENPSQKAFQPDSSRKFAFSFFPNFGINAAVGGPAGGVVKSFLFDDTVNGAELTLGEHKTSRVFTHINTYLFMLKAYRSLKGDQEVGISWQVRSDNQATISNETMALFDNYNLFDQNQYDGLFNNKAYSQTYHQIGISYRKDYDRRLGAGIKLSYLSGIAYNGLKVDSSVLSIDANADYYDLYLKGKFKSNFLYDDTISSKMANPGFKNPGLVFTASVNYKFRRGWYILANLKDIGFIKWSKKSYIYSLDRNIAISNASNSSADDRLRDELDFRSSYKQSGFTTLLNGKAELLINKNFGHYRPNLLLSKNLFYEGGDVALINNFNYNSLNLSLSTAYNTSGILQVGSQFMIKTPNKEFFIGSDQVFKTIHYIKAGVKHDETIAKGYPGASFYIGFAAKFGYLIEHPVNANRIPGMNTDEGFFERLLGRIGIRL